MNFNFTKEKFNIKRFLGSLPFSFQVRIANDFEIIDRGYTKYLIYKIRKIHPTIRFINPQEINEKLSFDRKSDVCHILGSGWSLLNTLNKIEKDKDYVFGFNFSALAYPSPDAHFIELASSYESKYNLISQAQYSLVSKTGLLERGKLVFKNIWENKNDLSTITKMYGEHAFFLKDYLIRCFSNKMLNLTCLKILTPYNNYIRQYSSSSLTLIALAKILGYRHIVLHGVDFYGPHFYSLPSFSPSKSLIKIHDTVKSKIISFEKLHRSSTGRFGQDKILPMIRRELENSGFFLYSASSCSPLSNILPVYYT